MRGNIRYMKIRYISGSDVGIEPYRPHLHIPYLMIQGRDKSRQGIYRDAVLIGGRLFSWRPKK